MPDEGNQQSHSDIDRRESSEASGRMIKIITVSVVTVSTLAAAFLIFGSAVLIFALTNSLQRVPLLPEALQSVWPSYSALGIIAVAAPIPIALECNVLAWLAALRWRRYDLALLLAIAVPPAYFMYNALIVPLLPSLLT